MKFSNNGHVLINIMVMFLHTTHIPSYFMSVHNSFFFGGGEVGRHLVKMPLTATMSP